MPYSASDLVGFLECAHLTNLERAAAAGLVARPARRDPVLDRIAERGLEHELRFLRGLPSGLAIAEIELDEALPSFAERVEEAAASTIAAMRRGDDVIYQAAFFDGRRRGFADFLRRVSAPSALGSWSYEVWDTKLARHAKASAVLQLAFYTDLVAGLQGRAPEHMYLALGGAAAETVSLRFADYAAYYRLVAREYEAVLDGAPPVYPPSTLPEPVEHCEVCRWAAVCASQRRAADDLSLVAGITARQRKALRAREIGTHARLAGLNLPLDPPVVGTRAASLARVREQARIQVEGDAAGRVIHELLPVPRGRDSEPQAGAGLLMLPTPSRGDLFFDIEGDPFYSDGEVDAIDYLFGVIEPGNAEEPTFHAIWSLNAEQQVTPAAERAAFEQLIDLFMDRLHRDPAMHIYHYASYEPTAIKRLAGRHGTREDQVDELLRRDVFVDLYRAVRQGIRASVESYSIKKLEPLYGFKRTVEMQDANSSIVEFETWLELGEGEAGAEILAGIEGYNRDDCVSTWQLRNWLEQQRTALEAELAEPLPRPDATEEEAAREPTAVQAETQALVNALLTGVPTDPAEASAEQHARWLLAELLNWHRREEKSLWWRYYFLKNELTDEERLAEREPLAMLTPLGKVGEVRRSNVYRFTFPPQEHDVAVGTRPRDPSTGSDVGLVEALDNDARWIEISRSKQAPAPEPASLIPLEVYPSELMRASLRRFASAVLQHGLAEIPAPYRAGRDLLLAIAPRAGLEDGIALAFHDEPATDAARRVVRALDSSYLAIQGPPGSGKSFTGAEMIVDLVEAGKRVGVTAMSHKVIGELLQKVAERASRRSVSIALGQQPDTHGELSCADAIAVPSTEARTRLDVGDVAVLGGTQYVWSRPDMAGAVDYLFIDEAGQLSLANALACAGAASNLVLLGDPQQLEQPLQGVHPPGADRSALAHVLGEHATMPPDRGLFLDGTWRLHPDIAAYTSEVFYEGRLHAHPGRERHVVNAGGILSGSGIRFIPVEHEGRRSESPEEVEAIAWLTSELLAGAPTWTDDNGRVQPLTRDDILIITPYNDQVRALLLALPGFRVGTVDKFQGQEAPVSIYSMATSSAEEAPRGMEFLYSLNRLNVATSRAQCLAAVVASPQLLLAHCRTPRQMQLANALARLGESATT